MKKFYLFSVLLLTSVLVYAQAPAKTTRQGIKALVTPSVTTRGAASYIPKGAPSRLPSATLEQQTQRALATSSNRNWWTRKARDYKAWQLKRQRRQRDIQNYAKQRLLEIREAKRAALPQLVLHEGFEVVNFTALSPAPLPAQPIPLLEEPGILYRGMALATDGKALKNIFQNGLLVADAGTEANTLNMAISGGQRGAVSALASRPVTNLTSFPQEAAIWGSKRVSQDKELLVVVQVDEQTRSGAVVTVDQDIPATQIVRVLAPLQINEVPTWCEISLTQDGNFLIIPYQTNP